jgi:hypothetical protein
MKYIVMAVKKMENNQLTLDMEIPFVFPDICVHLLVATVVKCMLEDQFEDAHIQPVSAGFVSSTAFEDECYGESTSLKIKSRPEDSNLIKMCDYGSMYA